MTDQDNPFAVPRHQSPSPEDHRLDTRATRAWLAGLPTGDPLATAREMIRYLVAMNLVTLPPGERIQSLESLHASLAAVSGQMTEKALRSTLPLSKRQREQLDLASSMRVLMVQGYKSGLRDLDRKTWIHRALGRNASAVAAHRVLSLLGEIILTSYRRYRPPLPHTWRELHGMYIYARRLRLQNRRIGAPREGDKARSSCLDIYKRILLLAASDPFGLPRDDVEYLVSELPRWAAACTLLPIRGKEHPGISIVVDPRSDGPPRRPDNRHEDSVKAGWRLDISPLPKILSQLRGAIQERSRRHTPTAKENAQSDLLTRLMHAWGERPERSAGHLRERRDIEVVRGVGSAVRVLCLAQGSKTDAEACRKFNAAEPLPEELRQMGWQSRARPAIQSYDYSEPENVTTLLNFHTESRLGLSGAQTLKGCRLSNESAMGCRLVQGDRNGRRVSVGDLVGIRVTEGRETVQGWRFGSVRWVRAEQQGGTDFGIRFIEGASEPVLLKPVNGLKVGAYPLPALLVSDDEHSPSLIVAPFGVKRGAEFSLARRDAEHRIVFRDEIESTSAFSRFTFEILGSATGPA